MKAGVKRKLCSSEPAHAKVAREDSMSSSGIPVTLSPAKRISTPSKRNLQNMASPRKQSFKVRSEEAGYGAEVFHSPMSSPFQSDIDTELGLIITLDEENDKKPEQGRKKNEEKAKKGKRKINESEISSADESSLDEESEEEFRKLDRDLAIKSKQHNLTSVDVRNIIHEVITNEHVVAMMKAAIKETQNMPMFEPKMTRSKLKEVVEKGVGIPNWNISPIKKIKETKPPQFVDIPLEEEDDSSDEEYYPNEDEEDETAEETIPESDMESIASSPRIIRRGRSCTPVQLSECEEEKNSSPQTKFNLPRHLKVEAAPMGPPAPPSQSCGSSHPTKAIDSFIEKLHAVDEELALNRLCMEPYQAGGEEAEVSLVACRTRSKRPLRDVPLDQLEAELQAPDITPDMYDCGLALEDKEWGQWLQGLMTSHPDNEEESDDDDDPEYNFLDDLDEPDLEDYRNDRAVRITKKEVNELMDELFETLQVETVLNEDEEDVEESKSSPNVAKFNVPQAIRFEEPLAFMLSACRQTVRQQLDALQQRRENVSRLNNQVPAPAMLLMPTPCTLVVTPTQKQQLRQQVQQHIQLLTQMNMLCSNVEILQSHTRTTKHFLTELQTFAERAEQGRAVVDPGFKSAFRVWNLQPSLDLLVELEKMPPSTINVAKRKQPHKVPSYPLLSPDLAWLFATRSVFLYPELLPHCSLDPRLHPTRKNIFTKGEDCLIALGLKHFSETAFPYHLMSQYLIQPKRLEQLRARVKDMSSSKASDNIIKFFCKHRIVPHLPVACCPVKTGEVRPPVEREVNVMPNWLQKSLPCIHNAVFGNQTVKSTSDTGPNAASSTPIFPRTTQYPQFLPKGVILQLHPSAKHTTTVRAFKPRPLYGFTSTSSTPLAKAPVCPTGTVNLVSSVSAPLSTQGVILLTPSPFLPVSEHLASAPLTATPSHGTVPSDNIGPINFQYVVPQLGCINPVKPSASLPTAAVKIASTPNLVCNSAIPAIGVGSKCVMQSVQKKAAVTKKQIMPRKLLPIQLTSPTPINLVSPAPAVDTLATADKKLVSNTSAPVLVIQPSNLVSTSYAYQQGPFKSITPSYRNFVQTISGLSCVQTPINPLVSDIVTKKKNNKKEAESELKSSPVYFVHTPSPPHVNPRLELSHSAQLVDSQNKQKAKCDAPLSRQENTSLNSAPLENQHPGLLTNGCNSKAALPHTDSSYNHSALTDPLVDNSQFVLVQTASQNGVPQFLLMSKSSVTQQSVLHSDVPGQNTTLSKSDTSQTVSVADIRNGKNTCKVELPTNTSQSQAISLSTQNQNEPCNEEDEAGAIVDREEMASVLFGSPLLMLSESSCSPHSILSENSCPDCSQPDENDTEISSASTPNSPSNIAGQSSSDCELQEIPGTITLTSGAENQEPPGSGENNGEERKEEGSEHQNREQGQGGDENSFGEDGQKQGDGESSGERDGQKERDGNGGKDRNNEEKDGDGEREEEEEDFDELTQDEDEEEVMSSASEESVLSVPELQETMEKLTWLASERRLCTEGESEEDNSPNSPASPTSQISQNSQEENSEDEEDGTMKGEEMEPVDGEVEKLREDVPQEDDPPQTSGKGAGRGRGRGRPPPRSLRKSKRQERGSKDTSKLLLLYDDHILENDPLRESKDIAFAQAYLNRVREALQDDPSKIEEFLSLLYEFEQGGEGRSAVELFSQLKPLLKEWPDLLRDFAAFLLPEQALECGLFEEQQAFERSRRFLRQLEISFGENPSHYQRIVKALQTATSITSASIEELKAQMATLLKGHTHLQGEFSVFFDELRPPPARPEQFEEAVWPEDGGSTPEGGDVINLTGGGGLSSGFEEVTLPDLEEEEELSKIPQITGKSRKRKKMGTHRNYKDCDWPEKECLCQCHFSSHDAKHRRHKRKGCSNCSVMKEITDVSKPFKSADRSFSQEDTLHERGEEKDYSEKGGDDAEEAKNESGSRPSSPNREEPEGQVWEGSEGGPPIILEERNEEEGDVEWKEGEKEHCSTPRRDDEGLSVVNMETAFLPPLSEREMGEQSRQSPSTEAPVCAKNISLTPSGERVVLWTREADRVILTACQQQGANPSTFQSVSAELGNKTASEVSKRFRDLMRLFHTSARQTSSEDEATEQQSATDDEQD